MCVRTLQSINAGSPPWMAMLFHDRCTDWWGCTGCNRSLLLLLHLERTTQKQLASSLINYLYAKQDDTCTPPKLK